MTTSESETNGNAVKESRTTSITLASSVEDLSEYTDADESMSAPTEILAEFLSSVMLKDYETALKYCKIILQYEPQNATAREFYPLIVEKLQMIEQERDYSDCEDGDSSSSSISEDNSSTSSSSESSSCSSCEDGQKPSDSDATTASYSSLEDDELDQALATATQSDIKNGNIRTRKLTSTNLKLSKIQSETKRKLTEEMKRKLTISSPVNRRPENGNNETTQLKRSPESPDSGFGLTDSESPTYPNVQEIK